MGRLAFSGDLCGRGRQHLTRRTIWRALPVALPTVTLSYVADLGPGVGALPPRARLTTDAPRLDLDGTWRFRLVPTLDDVTEGFEAPGYDASGWDEIPVPSTWQMIDIAGAAPYGKPAYLNIRYPFPMDVPVLPEANPTGEYVRTFARPSDLGPDAVLRFEGVESCFVVWLNGMRLGDAKGSRLPHEFAVRDEYRWTRTARVFSPSTMARPAATSRTRTTGASRASSARWRSSRRLDVAYGTCSCAPRTARASARSPSTWTRRPRGCPSPTSASPTPTRPSRGAGRWSRGRRSTTSCAS